MDIKKYGSYLQIEESPETRLNKEKEMFSDAIDLLIEMSFKEQVLLNEFHIDLLDYTNEHYSVIETLIYLKYGPIKGRVILWYIYERIDEDGTVGKLTLYDDKTNTNEVFTLNSGSELWEFLLKLKDNEERV